MWVIHSCLYADLGSQKTPVLNTGGAGGERPSRNYCSVLHQGKQQDEGLDEGLWWVKHKSRVQLNPKSWTELRGRNVDIVKWDRSQPCNTLSHNNSNNLLPLWQFSERAAARERITHSLSPSSQNIWHGITWIINYEVMCNERRDQMWCNEVIFPLVAFIDASRVHGSSDKAALWRGGRWLAVSLGDGGTVALTPGAESGTHALSDYPSLSGEHTNTHRSYREKDRNTKNMHWDATTSLCMQTTHRKYTCKWGSRALLQKCPLG